MLPALEDRARRDAWKADAPPAARRHDAGPAPASDGRRNRYARWAIHEGLAAGDRVAVLMRNQPDVLEIWAGLTGLGITVTLIDLTLRDLPLARLLDAVEPHRLVVDAGLADTLCGVQGLLRTDPVVWWHGHQADFARIDLEIEEFDGGPLDPGEVPRRP